jgi:diguanylate cyclase (GGDEF)-like protein
MILSREERDANAAETTDGSPLITDTDGSDLRATIAPLLRAAPPGTHAAIAWRHATLGEDVLDDSGDDPLRACTRSALDGATRTDTDTLIRCFTHADETLAIGLRLQADTDTDWIDRHWLPLAAQLASICLRLADAETRVVRLETSKRLQHALYEISDLAGSGLEMHEMLARIHGVVGELMPADNFFIVEYVEAHDRIRFLYFADHRHEFTADPQVEYPLSFTPLTSVLIRHGRPLIGCPLDILESLGIPYQEGTGGPVSEDWLGVPLLRDSRVCGAIVVQDYQRPNCYASEEQALLEYVGQHILTALDRKTAQVELERRVRERTQALEHANLELQTEVLERQRAEKLQQALFRITELSVSTTSLEHFYADLHGVIGELLYAKNLYIALQSADGKRIEFPYVADELDTSTVHDRPRGKGLTEYVIDTGKPLLARREDILVLEAKGLVHNLGPGPMACCWLGVPLTRDGVVGGVIGVQSYTESIGFIDRDQELLTFVAHHIDAALARKRAQDTLVAAHAELETRVQTRTRELADANRELREQIAERLRAEQRLRHQARHDSLTGLPNRAQLQERLDDAIMRVTSADARPFAVLFLDIDRFKLINDSVGHVAGDELLVESSRRISQVIRGDDLAARLGGDEFAILVENVETAEQARQYASLIHRALAQPLWIEGRELFPTASIGIALWHPRYRKSEELLRDADAAMYRAKRLGRNRSEVFGEEMRAEAMRLLDLEADLRRAIMHDAFEPHFQPILRLADRQQVGYEALVRWNHEQRGLLTPAEFIGVGEDSALIEQVDWLMYGHVVSSMGEYPKNYVSINVSPRHFLSDNFSDRLLRMLDEAGQDPRRLRIEITEVALIEDASRALKVLRDLRGHGIEALLDDFGTGFSALSYLHRFPIQGLKIDRSFVSGLEGETKTESLALVRAILAMALTLGIDTIAEGIETEIQRDILLEQGCQFGQGFLFGAPKMLERDGNPIAAVRHGAGHRPLH